MGNLGDIVATGITTHVLDTGRGTPAVGVLLRLEQWDSGWQVLGQSQTDAQGRCRDLLPPRVLLRAGIYRLVFDTGGYFDGCGVASFFPEVAISFHVREPHQHYHVPLLLSPFGYSTYRGT